MKLDEIIRTRRSIRRYLEQPLPLEIVRDIIRNSLWAPSSHNRQPWRFAILEKLYDKQRLAAAMGEALRADRTKDGDCKELIEKDVRNSYERLTGSPVLLVVFATIQEMDKYPDLRRNNNEYLMAVQSTAMAVQNILLSAHEKGVGACFMCAPLFCQEIVAGVLGVPPHWRAQGIVTLGYPKDRGRLREKKKFEDVVWCNQ